MESFCDMHTAACANIQLWGYVDSNFITDIFQVDFQMFAKVLMQAIVKRAGNRRQSAANGSRRSADNGGRSAAL